MWRNLPVCRVKFKATGRFHQLLVAFLENLNFMDWTLMSLATPARAAWLTCYLGLALPRFQLKTMGPSRQAQAGLAIETPGAPVAAADRVSAAAAGTDSNWLSFCSLSGRPFIVTKARLSHCINWIGLKGWRSLLHFAGHVRSLKLSRPWSHCVLKWGFTRTFLLTLYMKKQMRVLKSSNLGSFKETYIKVSLFRKDFLLFSLEPKNERKISALKIQYFRGIEPSSGKYFFLYNLFF